MRKFLLKIFFFVCPIVLAAYIADNIVTRGMRESQNGTVKVWNDIFEGKLNSDVLVYGSSRALNHVDPLILTDSLQQSVYNLGLSGHNFLMVKCRHDLAMKYNRVPKTIIVSIDLFLLDKRKDLFEYKYIAPFLNDPIVNKATRAYKGFDIFDYNLPLVRYIGYTKEIKGAIKYLVTGAKEKETVDRNGYSPHPENWNGEFDRLKNTMGKYKASMDTGTVRIFGEFLDEAHNKGINVILVYTPEYYEANAFVENKAEVMNVFTSFAQKYKLPLLDYSDDTLCRDKKYFYNAEHLNITGATLFSKRLAHDIKVLGLH